MLMATEKKETPEKTEKKPKGRKKRLLFILSILLLVILLGGGFLSYRLGLLEGMLDNILGAREGPPEVYKPPKYTFEMPEIVVNLAQEKRQFLSVKFYVGYDDTRLTEELEQRSPEIRDAVLGILWDKAEGDIKTAAGKEQLRQELHETINDVLQGGEIRRVYFWHVMIQ